MKMHILVCNSLLSLEEHSVHYLNEKQFPRARFFFTLQLRLRSSAIQLPKLLFHVKKKFWEHCEKHIRVQKLQPAQVLRYLSICRRYNLSPNIAFV